MKKVTTSKELGEAIKRNEDQIYIEGDLKNKVIRIKATGKVAWGIAGASIAAAIALALAAPAATVVTSPAGGVGGAISFTGSAAAATSAITILGLKATTVAITIGVASGGYAGIQNLRDNYSIVRKDSDGILMQRK